MEYSTLQKLHDDLIRAINARFHNDTPENREREEFCHGAYYGAFNKLYGGNSTWPVSQSLLKICPTEKDLQLPGKECATSLQP